MREILFRGKRIDNGEWVYGYYVEAEKLDKSGTEYFIIEKPADGKSHKVIPETVGQCTESTDKNGTKIFEGDIVAVNINGRRTICTVNWTEFVAHFQLWQINTLPKTPTALNLGNYDCEVIGNIHDNPELLKGGITNGRQ